MILFDLVNPDNISGGYGGLDDEKIIQFLFIFLLLVILFMFIYMLYLKNKVNKLEEKISNDDVK